MGSEEAARAVGIAQEYMAALSREKEAWRSRGFEVHEVSFPHGGCRLCGRSVGRRIETILHTTEVAEHKLGLYALMQACFECLRKRGVTLRLHRMLWARFRQTL